MTKLGVGIIGCGNISTSYCRLAPLFASLDLRAVSDIDMHLARARAADHGLRAETVEDLLRAPDIDVIVNLTVPKAHFAVTRRILEAGKHAYSEKPLALTLAEGDTLRELAAGRGLSVGAAPDTFLGGAHQQARTAIDAGEIGRVIGGTAHMMSRGMEDWHPNPDSYYQAGGGPILDVGPYYITNLVQLIGPVRSVAGLASTTFPNRTITNGARDGEKIQVDTATNIHALLEFAGGATVTLTTSWDVRAHRHSSMELYGEDGSLVLPDPNYFGGDVEIATADGPFETLPPWDHPFAQPNEPGRANYRCAGLADMVSAIAEGRDHRCNIDLALHVVDVMTGILKAAQERRFIDLATTCDRPAVLLPAEAQALLA